MMFNITLNESGYECTVDTNEYREIGAELPEDFGYENDGEDVTWVSADYAGQDPNWSDQVPADWPEHLPVWQARL